MSRGGGVRAILPDAKVVAVDTETSGLHADDGATVASVAIAWMEDGRIRSLGLPFDQGIRDKIPNAQLDLLEQIDPNLGAKDWSEFVIWLAGRELLVMHNAKFDLAMFNTGTRHHPGLNLEAMAVPIWDTMVAERQLVRGDDVGLDKTGERRGLSGKSGLEGVTGWLKANGFKPGRYDLVPWSVIEQYVVRDTELTLEIYLSQIGQLEAMREQDERAWRAMEDRIEREHLLLRALFRMESRGIGYDDSRSLEIADALEAKADELEQRLPFRGTKAAKRWFFDQKGVVPMKVSDKTGEPSLDEEQLRRLATQGVEWAAEYAEVNRLRGAVSRWYRGYAQKVGPDGRLRCTYRQTHVRSGRMSVERVNLQAIPKDDKALEGVPHVRDLIVPREGHGLWNLDLSQAELRVASRYARCERMLQMLAEGADLHSITAQEVLKADPDAPDWKFRRDIAKRLTFGGIFQIGAETFQATLGKLAGIYLPLAECQALVQGWRTMYPEFTAAYQAAERTVKRKGRVKVLANTPFEAYSWFGPRDDANTGWSRIVQGSLAELLKLWLIDTEALLHRRKATYDAMVLTVHDSIVLELPERTAEERKDSERVCRQIAQMGGQLGTRLFDIEMKVDMGRWRE